MFLEKYHSWTQLPRQGVMAQTSSVPPDGTHARGTPDASPHGNHALRHTMTATSMAPKPVPSCCSITARACGSRSLTAAGRPGIGQVPRHNRHFVVNAEPLPGCGGHLEQSEDLDIMELEVC
jgi:hypothetical protein